MVKVKLLLLLSIAQSYALFDQLLTKAFLDYKVCTMATFFGCSSKHGVHQNKYSKLLIFTKFSEQIRILKGFMEDNIRISVFNVQNRSFKTADVLTKQHHHIGVIIDLDCPNLEPFLIECANLKFFYESYHWLGFGSDYNVTEKFKNVGLHIVADVNVVIPNDEIFLNWTVLDVYNPAQNRGGDLKVEEIGFYNSDDGYNVQFVWNRYYKRRNMTGVTFRAGMVIPENISTSLEEYLDNDKEKNNNTFSRFNSVATQICQDFYNFSMNKSYTNSWGYVQDDGEIDGLSAELKYERVDFGIAAVLYRLFRLKVHDYGYGNWIMKSTFIFRHPKSTLSSYELYLRPLKGMVWICTLLALGLMVIVLRFIITSEMKLLRETSGDNTWSFLVIYNIGELCQQGFSYIPTLASGRIVVLSVLIFFFLIYQFYSASIVSFLLLPPRKTITTVPDLIKSSLGVGMENILYDVDYMKTTNDPVAVALYHKKIKLPNNKTNFLRAVEGMEKVKAGDYAFHTQTSTGYPIVEKYFEERAICELAEVQLYNPVRAHMAVTKKSPIKEIFMYCNVYQMEVGILHRLRHIWDARKPQCVDYTPYLEVEVGLTESYWGLLLLGVGIFLSLFLLLLENAWVKWGQHIFTKEKMANFFVNKL